MWHQLPQCTSAADIAAKTQQAVGLKISASAIMRLVRKKGLQHSTAKIVPIAMLTAKQKLARVTFTKAALRREQCSRCHMLLTDSKYFRLHSKGQPAGRWCTPATEELLPDPSKTMLPMCPKSLLTTRASQDSKTFAYPSCLLYYLGLGNKT